MRGVARGSSLEIKHACEEFNTRDLEGVRRKMRNSRSNASKRRRETRELSAQAQGVGVEAPEPQEELVGIQAGARRLDMSADILAKFNHFMIKPIGRWSYIDLPLMDSFGCREGVERLMSQPYWNQLFSWRDHTLGPIVHEFVASLKISGRPKDLTSPTIQFRVFNTTHHISVNTLGRLLGFYTQEEQEDEWYQTLPLEFEDDRTPIDYWATIARSGIRWQGSRVHESHIARNDIKVVRRLLAYHWTGRRSNASKVYRTDLFAPWSMDTGTPINMGMICKTWLDSQSVEGVATIFVGPLVSRHCIGLGYTAELAQEVRVRESEMTPFSQEDMLLLEITPIPVDNDMDPPPPPMPTFSPVPPHYATVTNWTTVLCQHSITNST
nr:retrotransposon Orf1 [Ipomoea batatas]